MLFEQIKINLEDKKKSLFFRKIMIVMSGTLIAQIIGMGATPFITRLYTPEDFGYFSNITSLSSVFVPLLTFSYSLAIVLPKKEKNALSLMKFIFFLITILSFVLLFILKITNISNYIHLGRVSVYEIIFYSYLLSIFEVLTYWLIRKESFSFRSKIIIFQVLIVLCLKILIGLFYSNESILLYSSIVGLILVNIIIIYKTKIYSIKGKKYRGLLTAKKYAYIAKFRTPQNMFANFNQLLPIMMLTYFYGARVAGMYALAKTVLLLPGNLIAKSIVDVLYPNLCKKHNEYKKIGSNISKSVLILSSIGLIPLFVILFLGEYLFSLIFGDNWSNAGQYAQWLCIWLYFNFINKPYVTLIPIFKLEKIFLKNSILNTVLSAIGLWLGFILFHSASYSILLFSLFSSIPQIMIIIIVRKKIIEYDNVIKI